MRLVKVFHVIFRLTSFINTRWLWCRAYIYVDERLARPQSLSPPPPFQTSPAQPTLYSTEIRLSTLQDPPFIETVNPR